MDMNVNEAIRTMRAIRDFSPEPLSEDTIYSILNSGRRAQSSKNSQPWHIIAMRDRSILIELSRLGDWADHLAGAAFGVALLSPDPSEKFQTMFDLGQCAAYMQLAAWELGVGSCPASIYMPDAARSLLAFPDDLHLRIAISFGYPLNKDQLITFPKKGGRKSFEETIHWEKW